MGKAPTFVTFTGVDERTDIDGMKKLSALYPIEWGILFSQTRQGKHNRYPPLWKVMDVVFERPFLRLAAHWCGQHARDALTENTRFNSEDIVCFDRVQINHPHPNIEMAATFQRRMGTQCIIQVRGEEFPDAPVSCLFDRSGGRGEVPSSWPRHPGWMAGYAGGITPENVSDVVKAIDADGPYWIDMESGVRTDDWLDLEKCRAVCEAVYGRPAEALAAADELVSLMEQGLKGGYVHPDDCRKRMHAYQAAREKCR